MLWRVRCITFLVSIAGAIPALAQSTRSDPPVRLLVHAPSTRSPARLVRLSDEASRAPSLLAPGTTQSVMPLNTYGPTGVIRSSTPAPPSGCACITAPPSTVYYPSPPVTVSPVYRVVAYRPVIALRPMPQSFVAGQGILGQPKLYMPGQPLRNFIRYLTP